MSDEKIPYVKWGDFHSKNKDNPDRLEIKVVDPATFESEYSVNVAINVTENGKVQRKNLPLKSHESSNASLLNMWNEQAKKDMIRQDTVLTIKTWMGLSKNNRPIRRYELEF